MLPLMPIMVTMDIPATMVDTVDTTVTDSDTADTTADTIKGKPRLNPLPPLRPIPPPMLGTDTTVVVMDTVTVWDTADTTVVLMDMDTDTTVVTGNFPTPKSHLSFRNENIFSHL